MRIWTLLALIAGAALSSYPNRATGPDTVLTGAGTIEITPIVHSSVQIESGGKVVQVDP
jgi:hypothetical protein